jgi:hypothetical protein
LRYQKPISKGYKSKAHLELVWPPIFASLSFIRSFILWIRSTLVLRLFLNLLNTKGWGRFCRWKISLRTQSFFIRRMVRSRECERVRKKVSEYEEIYLLGRNYDIFLSLSCYCHFWLSHSILTPSI